MKVTRLRNINVFVTTEKRPWIKSKTKQGPNKKKINDFYPNRRKNLAEVTRACSSINTQKAKQLVLHLWMYQQSVRGKTVEVKKAEDTNVMRGQFPRMSPDYSSFVRKKSLL